MFGFRGYEIRLVGMAANLQVNPGILENRRPFFAAVQYSLPPDIVSRLRPPFIVIA